MAAKGSPDLELEELDQERENLIDERSPIARPPDGNPDGSYMPQPRVLPAAATGAPVAGAAGVHSHVARTDVVAKPANLPVAKPTDKPTGKPEKEKEGKKVVLPAAPTKEQAKAIRKKMGRKAKMLTGLVAAIRNNAFLSVFSNEAVMGCASPRSIQGKVKMINEAIKYYFEESVKDFDDELRSTLMEYLTLVMHIYDTMVPEVEVDIIGPAVRFVLIAICFGIDRAVVALTDNDVLFRTFTWRAEDVYFDGLYDVEDLPEMADARYLYYAFFSEEGHDPRVTPHKTLPKVLDKKEARKITVNSQKEVHASIESARKHKETADRLELEKQYREREARERDRKAQEEAQERARRLAEEEERDRRLRAAAATTTAITTATTITTTAATTSATTVATTTVAATGAATGTRPKVGAETGAIPKTGAATGRAGLNHRL